MVLIKYHAYIYHNNDIQLPRSRPTKIHQFGRLEICSFSLLYTPTVIGNNNIIQITIASTQSIILLSSKLSVKPTFYFVVHVIISNLIDLYRKRR